MDIYTYIFIHNTYDLYICIYYTWGPGSSVVIATDYRLDNPGIQSRWGEILHPSRLALELIQPPVQWVPGLSRG
jgi:hypothetical protein